MGWVRLSLLVALLAFSVPGSALRFSFSSDFFGGLPFVFIQVGHGLLTNFGLLGPPIGQVDLVSFSFPVGVQPGDGTPVAGTPVMPIAFLGYSGNNQANYRVTMDSSAGLMTAGGDSMPFSEFSWTTQDGDIPSGQFSGLPGQLLQDYFFNGNRARGIVDYLTFSYANATIYTAGTYDGRVVYTITEL